MASVQCPPALIARIDEEVRKLHVSNFGEPFEREFEALGKSTLKPDSVANQFTAFARPSVT